MLYTFAEKTLLVTITLMTTDAGVPYENGLAYADGWGESWHVVKG